MVKQHKIVKQRVPIDLMATLKQQQQERNLLNEESQKPGQGDMDKSE